MKKYMELPADYAVLSDDEMTYTTGGSAVGGVVTIVGVAVLASSYVWGISQVIVPVRAVTVDNTPAVIAAHVILIEAVIAERVRVVLDSIFLINPFVAVVADYGQPVGAILAEPVIFHLEHFVNRMLCTTVCTNSCFTHWLVLHFV